MSDAFFSDLDNTLLFSSNSKHYAPELELVQVEQHASGQGFGYFSEVTLARLRQLSEQIPFIPTTTRTESQYARIAFPGVQIPYAIVGNGAVLLKDGARDDGWERRVYDEILPQARPLKHVRRDLSAIFDAANVTRREHTVEELFIYDYLLDPISLPSSVMLSVESLAVESNWKISIQNRKFYLLPLGLTKGVAAREVAERLGIDRMLAAGDSLLDASLLDEADVAWGMQGELDRLNPYPYERIPEHGFAGSELLLREVAAEIAHHLPRRGATNASPADSAENCR